MTEKRFKLDSEVGFIDTQCDKNTMTLFEVVVKLNKLNEENEQLKEDYDYLEKRFKEEEWHYDYIDEDRDAWRHKCQELEKENEELKQKVDFYKYFQKDARELEKENEQLKEQNRQLRLENGKLTHDLFWANKKIKEKK